MLRSSLGLLGSFVLAAIALAIPAQAQFTIASPTTEWVTVPYPPGTTTDFHVDQQTGSGEADIVGGGTLPSFYTKLVPGANNTTGTLYFRARLGADDSPAGFKSACFLGVDANGDGKLDLFFGVNNSGNPNGIYIWKAGTGANISPSTTSIDSQNPVATYTLTAANYLWTEVTATNDPAANTLALRNLDGRTGTGQTDYFLNFALPFADIVAAFQAIGITVNTSTVLNYVMGTATQANAFNQDLNGVNGGTSSSQTWASLGALSLPLNSTGTAVLAPPVINSSLSAAATYGSPFSYTITATNSPTSFAATGLPAGVSISPATGVISGTSTAPGTYSITISATNADGTGSAQLVLTVGKAALTVTAASVTRPFGQVNPTLTAVYSGFVNGETLATSGVAGSPGLNTSATVGSSVGTYPITISAGSLTAANYSFTYVQGSLTIIVSAQVIDFPTLANVTYGAAPVPLAATASSGLPVSYVVLSGPATLAGGTLTVTGAGVVQVRAQQSGNTNYSAAPSVERSITIAKAPLTITAEDKVRAFGEANPAFTAAYSGFVNGETLATSGVTGVPALSTSATTASAPGDYVIAAAISSLSSANYTFAFNAGTLSIGAASQTITFSAPANATYGTAPIALTATASSGLTVSYSVISGPASVTGSSLTVTGAGEIMVRATQAGDTSYLAAAPVERSITIAKAPLSVTAEDKVRAFGEANPALTAIYSGFGNGETLGTSGVSGVPALSTSATTASAPGDYAITAAIGSLSSANYSFVLSPGTLTIGAGSQTIDFPALPNATYGTSPVSLGATASSGLPVSYVVISGPATVVDGKLSITGAGEVIVSAIQPGNASYDPAPAAERILTVAKAVLTVTAESKSRQMGQPNPLLTATFSGFVNGETLATSGISGAPELNSSAEPTSAPATYAITASLGTLQSSNYAFAFVPGTMSVGVASQTITFPAINNAVYGDGPVTLKATASSGLSVSYAIVTGPATVSGSTLTITGAGEILVRASQAGDANYGAALDEEQRLTVAKATLTVTAADKDRPFGEVNPALTHTYSGFVNGETLASSGVAGLPSLSTSATPASPVGTYPISISTGSLSAGNYLFNLAPGTLTVTAASQTISFPALNGAIYGAPAVALAATSTSGLPVSYAVVSGPGTVTGSTLTILGAGEIVVRASQAGDANHGAAQDVERSVTISRAILTVSAADKVRPVGMANPAFTADFGGFLNGESLATSGVTGVPALATTATLASPAGEYPISASLGTLSSANYSFVFLPGTLVVGSGGQVIDFPPPGVTTYGAGTIALEATASSGLPVSYSVLSGPGAILDGVLTITGAGEIVVRASQPGDASYEPAPHVVRSVAVGKATLTVTAEDQFRNSGEANPVLAPAYSGFVFGESLATSGVTGSPALTTTATQSSAPGDYPIIAALGSLSSSSYLFTFVPGTLTISYVNQAPSFAVGTNPTVNEDSGPQSIAGVLTEISPGAANESIQALTFTLTNSDPSLFSVQPKIAPDGTLTFTPAIDAYGTSIVTVYLRDDGGTANGGQDTSAIKTFQITLAAVNDAPVAVTDIAATTGENPVTLDVLANDSDVDSDTIVLKRAILTSGEGSIEIHENGEITFTAAAGFRGAAVITYEIEDLEGAKASGQFRVTVNAAPVATADVAATPKDAVVAIDVLANDADADGDPLSITQFTIVPAFGTASLEASKGFISFTPAAGLIGTVYFTYAITDGRGGHAQATVTVMIGKESEDLPPIVHSDSATTAPGVLVSIPVLENDSDPEGTPLTIVSATVNPVQGTVSIVGANLEFVPANGFLGGATIRYTASDAGGKTAEGVVLVDVTTGQAPPVAVDDVVRAESGVAKNFSVMLNDFSPGGSSLKLVNAVITSATAGTARANSDGTITFQSVPAFTGGVEIVYTIEDEFGQTGQATLNIDVFSVLQNSAPLAVNDTAYTLPGQAISLQPLANDIDSDGDALTIQEVSLVEGEGTLSLSAGNELTFIPAPGFSGLVTIAYRIADPAGAESAARILIVVNTPPVAAPDLAKGGAGKTITLNVLDNDSDADGHALQVTAFTGDLGAGQFDISPSGVLEFTSNQTFSGLTILTYTLTDSLGAVVEGQVIITVNDAPIARNDSASTPVGSGVSVNVLANDSDPNGDVLRIVAATVEATQGTVTIESDGTLLFIPASTFRGEALIRYLVADSLGETAAAEVTIGRINTAPEASGRTVYGFCDVPLSINALRGAGDADGDTLRVLSVTQPSHGKVSIGANGYVTYTPRKQFNNPSRTDSFTVTVEDGQGGVSTMTVEVAAFNSLKGTYQSLITPLSSTQMPAGESQPAIAGSLTLTLANGATFSGSLQLGTQRHAFSGRLSGALKYERKLKVSGFPAAKLTLTFIPETKVFSAEITGMGQVLTAASGLQITARKHAASGVNFAGVYRADLQHSTGDSEEPLLGDLMVKVSRKGRAVYRGYLPDGRPVTGGTRVFGDARMPLYSASKSTRSTSGGYLGGTVVLYSSPGGITGVLQENFGTLRLLKTSRPTAE